MLGPVFYLAGDSFPRCRHMEQELHARLAPAVASWTGQRRLLAQTQAKPFNPDIPHRLGLLDQAVPKGGGAVLLGRSSGARVATLFATRSEVAAVICLGYPFYRRKRPLEPERYAHLARIATSTLIFQGRSDMYGGTEVTSLFELSPAVTVEFLDCDHEFHLTAPAWDAVAQRILDFSARASRAEARLEPVPAGDPD
ncbi:hypothetical protein EJV46_00580 [Roseococcus sp. SYP-B2431]|uniref:alpha/beta family hydrolase n=1 Tax=Roseococcus sp. SYP-B2431 TaxID=2496640 RepID=UPI00103A669E|nr:alpha/beta family hydrolase [Roseococcus sp. SYP-B2431]TCI00986.1 hypothetical protein EJV46_00580 [Roseococcus sp. SYP-B2431]